MFVCMCRSWVPETIDDTTTILKLHKTTEEQNFSWKSYKKFSWDPRATCTHSTLIPVLFFAMQSPVYGACLKWDTNHCLLPSCVAARLSCLPYPTPLPIPLSHPAAPPSFPSSPHPALTNQCYYRPPSRPPCLHGRTARPECSLQSTSFSDLWPERALQKIRVPQHKVAGQIKTHSTLWKQGELTNRLKTAISSKTLKFNPRATKTSIS